MMPLAEYKIHNLNGDKYNYVILYIHAYEPFVPDHQTIPHMPIFGLAIVNYCHDSNLAITFQFETQYSFVTCLISGPETSQLKDIIIAIATEYS